MWVFTKSGKTISETHCLLVSRRQLETPQNYDVDSEVHTDDNHSERF